ncbi:unnamed protein product [Haemonchus placei]|uniref:Diablo homolog, mitochondrial n=1 Tax=Haemonchus placei TaxID=6290 RepID=A0A0N4WKI3_HAEPC|nr:unnamed protein product [Haemonchus placei]
MVGPAVLSSKKGLLTRYCNKIESLLKQYEDYKRCQEGPASMARAPETKEWVLRLNATSQLVSEALLDFTGLTDSLADTLAQEQLDQANAYIERAQECIDNAQSTAVELEAKRISAMEIFEGPGRSFNNSQFRAPQTSVEP